MALAAFLTRIRKADSTTCFLLGACTQFALSLCLPIHVSFVPIATILIAYSLKNDVRSANPTLTKSTSIPDDVLQGRYTAQIPHKDRSGTQQGAGEEIVVFVLGASSHSAQGRADPAFQELNKYFRNMWKEAEADRRKWGFLGRSTIMEGTTPDTRSMVISLSYWKNLESLHAFAQGPTHRAGWDWWNRTEKQLAHIGIMHEVYAAPKGHWENIYHNFKPFGMGQTLYADDAMGNEYSKSPLIPARGKQWGSMLSRMGRKDMGVE